jgi:hypothetical protein
MEHNPASTLTLGMKMLNSAFVVWLRKTALVCLVGTASLAHADIFWTGTTNTFTHNANTTTADQLTTNHFGADSANNVWLTRGTSQPLFNAAAESSWNGSGPANTEWALASGPLTNAASLTYDTFANVVGAPGNTPRQSIGKTFFVRITSDNIYFVLKLTAWGNNNGGSFQYQRSSPAVVSTPTPTVSLTSPTNGAVFASPANVNLVATNATVSSGTVTNVQFFTNGVSLKSVSSAPFTLTASNLTAGAYALKAVATAAGVSATSSVVNVTVVSPVTVNLSAAGLNNGKFSFNYAANPGLAYVVESSTNLLNWTPVVTNVAPGNPAPFTNAVNATGIQFYRVGRLPNP